MLVERLPCAIWQILSVPAGNAHTTESVRSVNRLGQASNGGLCAFENIQEIKPIVYPKEVKETAYVSSTGLGEFPIISRAQCILYWRLPECLEP